MSVLEPGFHGFVFLMPGASLLFLIAGGVILRNAVRRP